MLSCRPFASLLRLARKPIQAAILLCALSGAKCPPLRDALKAYEMIEVRPASSYLMPGTLVWLSSERPLVAGRLCSYKTTMGEQWEPSESRTVNTDLVRAAKKGINFKVDVQSLASASADFSAIKDVSLSLKNTKLYELTDFDISERDNDVDQRCLRALQRRQRAGFRCSIVSASLVADMQYHVRFASDSNLSVQAKIAQLEALSAHLGLESSTVTDSTISADGLVIGARIDDFLAYLYSPAHLAQADNRRSVIPSEWDGRFIDKEDASSTTSGGDMPTLADSQAEGAYWSSVDLTDSDSEQQGD